MRLGCGQLAGQAGITNNQRDPTHRHPSPELGAIRECFRNLKSSGTRGSRFLLAQPRSDIRIEDKNHGHH